jgi:hypothetical protein
MTIVLYEKCLATHDWQHEYSDEYRITRKGREEKEQLQRMQKLYDTDFTLWNYYAPEEFKRGIANECNIKAN